MLLTSLFTTFTAPARHQALWAVFDTPWNEPSAIVFGARAIFPYTPTVVGVPIYAQAVSRDPGRPGQVATGRR